MQDQSHTSLSMRDLYIKIIKNKFIILFSIAIGVFSSVYYVVKNPKRYSITYTINPPQMRELGDLSKIPKILKDLPKPFSYITNYTDYKKHTGFEFIRQWIDKNESNPSYKGKFKVMSDADERAITFSNYNVGNPTQMMDDYLSYINQKAVDEIFIDIDVWTKNSRQILNRDLSIQLSILEKEKNTQVKVLEEAKKVAARLKINDGLNKVSQGDAQLSQIFLGKGLNYFLWGSKAIEVLVDSKKKFSDEHYLDPKIQSILSGLEYIERVKIKKEGVLLYKVLSKDEYTQVNRVSNAMIVILGSIIGLFLGLFVSIFRIIFL